MAALKFPNKPFLLFLSLMKNKLALYIHLPFCRRKCTYCDFLSFSSDEQTRRNYIEALLGEFDLYHDLLASREITSVYFGGGTPSLLSLKELDRLMEGIFSRIHPTGELSFEMNPEDVEVKKLSVLKEYGDFRISLGTQSFDEDLLLLFGRTHGVKEIFRSIERIRSQGFTNLSFDIIYAVEPRFSMKKNLEAIREFDPEHLSCYALELHPRRPLAKILEEPSDELYIRDWQELKTGLQNLGYQRYEISSFARELKISQHNVNYWRGGDYLGLGLGAHGLISPRRYVNERNLKKYLQRISGGEIPLGEEQLLTEKDQRFESFMLGLRMVEGIDLHHLLPLTTQEEKAIIKHTRNNLLCRQGEKLFLTEEGFDLFNHVLVDFL